MLHEFIVDSALNFGSVELNLAVSSAKLIKY